MRAPPASARQGGRVEARKYLPLVVMYNGGRSHEPAEPVQYSVSRKIEKNVDFENSELRRRGACGATRTASEAGATLLCVAGGLGAKLRKPVRLLQHFQRRRGALGCYKRARLNEAVPPTGPLSAKMGADEGLYRFPMTTTTPIGAGDTCASSRGAIRAWQSVLKKGLILLKYKILLAHALEPLSPLAQPPRAPRAPL